MKMQQLTEFIDNDMVVPYYENICGVYILSDEEDNIVYVGKSVDIGMRLKDHRRKKRYAIAHYIRCSRKHLDHFEQWLIALTRPKFNKQLNSYQIKPFDELIRFAEGLTVEIAAPYPYERGQYNL